jgi:hypothetical protein
VGRHPGSEVREDLGVPYESSFSLADFDRYVEEHGIPEEDALAAFCAHSDLLHLQLAPPLSLDAMPVSGCDLRSN